METSEGSTVWLDVKWHHDFDTVFTYCGAQTTLPSQLPPLAMHTQFKAACQRSELFYTTSIQSVRHAWLGGDSRCLGWIHGVNTVISSQHGLVLTSRRLDDSRQAVWRRVKFFYSCCCWVFFNDRKPSYCVVGGFYSDHENWKGVDVTSVSRWWPGYAGDW